MGGKPASLFPAVLVLKCPLPKGEQFFPGPIKPEGRKPLNDSIRIKDAPAEKTDHERIKHHPPLGIFYLQPHLFLKGDVRLEQLLVDAVARIVQV